MGIHDHLVEFAGLPVFGLHWDYGLPTDPAAVAWRLNVQWQNVPFTSVFDEMMAAAGPGGPRALIVGNWGAPDGPFPVEVLTRNAEKLGELRGLFIGEMSSEENELSWIKPGDLTGVLDALPGLQHLWIRGTRQIALSEIRHENLHELVIQSAGLPAAVARAIGAADLPALEKLELWLGSAEHGGDTSADDLAPILAGHGLPRLSWLGLRNSEITDDLAVALADAPVVDRLRVLDLSWGTLGDTGAEALLAGRSLTHLEHLVLNHHYLSPTVAQRLVDELPTVSVDVSGPQQKEEWGRYTAVSE